MMGNMNNSMNGSMNRMGGTSKDALLMARNAYEAQYGPLRAENARDTVYWSWTDDPWPWEGGGY